MADSLKAAKSKKKRTYLDTGVLFAAFRGEPSARIRALTILSDPDRDFVASDYLMLETSPKAIYHRNISEKAGFTLRSSAHAARASSARPRWP